MYRLLSLFLIALPGSVISQSLPLQLKSYGISLFVAHDESMMLTTKAGEFGIFSTGGWQRKDPRYGEYNGNTLDHSNFFNKDTGFVSGFIHHNNKNNIIFRTSNGGNDWTRIDFGQNGWIDAATNLDNGEAWLSVAGSGIAYTKDFGVTWNKKNLPEKRQRFAQLYLNHRHQGLIGSLWNVLAYTADNCDDWKFLPTPLDQKKYNKTNQNARPEITGVAIFRDFFLVAQEGLVFYSKADSINWIPLPPYSSFYTDPDNSALYFKLKNGNYVRSDSSLKIVSIIRSPGDVHDAICRKGTLFVLNNAAVSITRSDGRQQQIAFPVISQHSEPVDIGYSGARFIGIDFQKVYSRKTHEEEWKELFTLPFAIDSQDVSLTPDGRLLTRSGDSLIYFTLKGKVDRVVSTKSIFQDFVKTGIKSVHFSQGSQGCFHNYSNEVRFENDGDRFIATLEESGTNDEEMKLPPSPDEIDLKAVEELIGSLPLLMQSDKMISITDLGFTDRELEQCRKDIIEFRENMSGTKKQQKDTDFFLPENNIDFVKLLSMVDSVETIDSWKLFTSLMNVSQLWSTTINSKVIKLVNFRDETLTIGCSFQQENAFLFPWRITVDGYSTTCYDYTVNRFINAAYPRFLDQLKRLTVLHSLVQQIYKDQKDREDLAGVRQEPL